MVNGKIEVSILASTFDVMMILFRDKRMETLGWKWGMYGLVVVLNEKKNYYPRIVPSFNMPRETRCYIWYQSKILFGDLGFVDDLEIVDLEQILWGEMIRIRGFICWFEVINR